MQQDLLPAVGCLTAAEDAVTSALSKLATMQSLLEVSSDSAAREKIWLDYWPQPWDGEEFTKDQMEALLAGVLVFPTEDQPYTAGEVNGVFNAAGSMTVLIRRLIREKDEHLRAGNDRQLKLWFEAIMKELSDQLKHDKGRGWAAPIAMTRGPHHNSRKGRPEQGHWVEVELVFAWGHPNLKGTIV